MDYQCPEVISYPNRVDIQPNGWNIGCFWLAEGEDLECELEGSELCAYQKNIVDTEVLFDKKVVLIVGPGGEEFMSCLEQFNIDHPFFFFHLSQRLLFVPDNYTDDIVGWEISKHLANTKHLFEITDITDPPF